MVYLNDDQIRGFHDCFCLFAKNRDYIRVSQLRECVLYLGLNPTDVILQRLQWEFDKDDNGKIFFSEFIQLLTRLFEELDEVKQGMSEF